MKALPIPEIIAVIASLGLVVSSLLVIIMRNPVRSVLSLVLCFLFTTVLWMLLQAEFLSLVLIFVYIGAVMTLFMFVVMMLHIDRKMLAEKFVSYLPLGIVLLLVFVGIVLYALHGHHFPHVTRSLPHFPDHYNNTKVLGTHLYTQYVLPFEMASIILLVAILAAISLVFQGREPGTKAQRVEKQLQATKKNRLVLVDIKTEKP